MKYIVAVSGGVDSVVMLDMLVHGHLSIFPSPTSNPQLVVAHFDHGIRQDSADDAEFVRQLAAKYELPFETTREELGKNASEELARDRRYVFLRKVAKKYGAKIVTAHHADDVVETIAINLTRGTGWRGLAVLDSPDIVRPLLAVTKDRLVDYAKRHDLQWCEDVTNRDTKYLRNELRQKLTGLDPGSRDLLRLYRERQVFLRREIDNEIGKIIHVKQFSRHLFIMVPEVIGIELLRGVFEQEAGSSPTRPQLTGALLAIKTLRDGKRYEVAAGTTLQFTATDFIVEAAI